jgi:hypothetical protein
MTPVATADRWLWWRNSSRLWTFEMCTSMSGAVSWEQASRMAIE